MTIHRFFYTGVDISKVQAEKINYCLAYNGKHKEIILLLLLCDRKCINTTSFIVKKNSTGERDYACEVCGATYVTGTDLRRHRLKHSEVKPYPCHLCEKQFTRSHDLKVTSFFI